MTRRDCKQLLFVVHTVTSGQRLRDALRLVESDLRIQVIFTAAPDVFSNGVREFIKSLGVMSLPWEHATRQPFDLAIAASLGGLHEVHAPLIVMPHGAGFNKLPARGNGAAVATDRVPYGLDAQRLVHNGVVLPAAIALQHRSQVERLGRSCPEALPAAEVVGDFAYDRLVMSMQHRALYRQALGVGHDQKVVVVTSTWGPESLFGRRSELYERLMEELPPKEYRVVALFHPNVWFAHGIWQIKAWLAGCMREGLSLVSPDAHWEGPIAAADLVIGDHGSVTLYGAVAGVPIMLAEFSSSEVDPASPAAHLASFAPRVSRRGSLHGQLHRAVADFRPERYRELADGITSAPGRFDRNMRQLMYRLLQLREPPTIPATGPAYPPFLVD
ncbi:hypothetical protein GCM10009677_04090 [Sphaerisporangium rubeum]|uniref:Uncharacterized protein n=1 Tax=Sphaerisporangium rubeum TaxID=321317 RepID=A0A7X0M3L4_9ACTN|nr:hypothetical protein [Sphaerisporangium rubeum]